MIPIILDIHYISPPWDCTQPYCRVPSIKIPVFFAQLRPERDRERDIPFIILGVGAISCGGKTMVGSNPMIAIQ